MEKVRTDNGIEFARVIEEDEDVPLKNLHLLNGHVTLYKGLIGDSTWTCIYRIRGG